MPPLAGAASRHAGYLGDVAPNGNAGPELVERVRGVVPLLASEAEEAERLRRPTDAAIAALRETGVFELMVPRRHGGLELDLDTFLQVGLLLARADTSIAWVTTFYVEHNWMLCQLPETFQRALYADRSHVLAPAAIAPTGEGRRDDGGYRLSGRWRFGTGAMHGEWTLVGAPSDPEQPEASLRMFALPMSDVKVEDTWYVDGMVGTGSNDLVVDDVFVPAERTEPVDDLLTGKASGSRLHDGPLYRTPMIPILLLAASLPVVGAALAAVDGFRERLAGHVRMGSKRSQARRPAAQMRLARAAIEASQAERLLRDVASDVMARRDAATLEDRARWAASAAHAVQQARRVVQSVAEGSGASAHYQQHRLQRALRDVNMASCHVVFDADAQSELYGRLLLGFEPKGGLF